MTLSSEKVYATIY